MKTILLLLAIAALPAYAQTWFSPTPQIVDGNMVVFTSTATVRYGQDASTCVVNYMTCVAGKPSPASWLPPVTITATAASPVTIVVGTAWAKSDPIGGVPKQLEIQQTSVAQTVKVTNNSGGTVTLTVPALPVVTPPAPTPTPAPTVIAVWNCNLNQMSDGTFVSIAGSCVKK